MLQHFKMLSPYGTMAVVAGPLAIWMEYGSDYVVRAAVILIHNAEPLFLACDHDKDGQVAWGVTVCRFIRMKNLLQALLLSCFFCLILERNCFVDTRFVQNHWETQWEKLRRLNNSSDESLFYPTDKTSNGKRNWPKLIICTGIPQI